MEGKNYGDSGKKVETDYARPDTTLVKSKKNSKIEELLVSTRKSLSELFNDVYSGRQDTEELYDEGTKIEEEFRRKFPHYKEIAFLDEVFSFIYQLHDSRTRAQYSRDKKLIKHFADRLR